MLTTIDQKLLALAAVVILGLFGGSLALAGENRLPPLGSSVQAMPPEMGSAYARAIQRELNDRGYDVGPADGTIGPRTTRAIRAYQRDAGLPVDGRATDTLLDHLYFAQPKVQRRQPAIPAEPSVISETI